MLFTTDVVLFAPRILEENNIKLSSNLYLSSVILLLPNNVHELASTVRF